MMGEYDAGYENYIDSLIREIEKLQEESDRLREQIHWLKKGDILHVLTDQEYIDQCERERLMQVSIDALDKDNAKLREQLEACEHDMRAETCEADETDTWECVRDDLGGYGKALTVHVMECTECGHTYEHVNGDYEFCPRCGRKRKDVDA